MGPQSGEFLAQQSEAFQFHPKETELASGLPLKVVKSSFIPRYQGDQLRCLINTFLALQRPSFDHGPQQLRIPHSQPPYLHHHIGELQLRSHCSRTTRSSRTVCNHKDLHDSSRRGYYINGRLGLPLRSVMKVRYRRLRMDKLQESDIGTLLHAWTYNILVSSDKPPCKQIPRVRNWRRDAQSMGKAREGKDKDVMLSYSMSP